MKKRELSIIIPCYNVENYINNCLISIKPQLESLTSEIILIDDYSKDNTKKVIKDFIKNNNDMDIKLIENKENIGAGASRNRAIKECKYNIVSFIDSDDYLDDNYYEELFKEMESSHADLVACDIMMVDEKTGDKTLAKACNFVPSKYNLIDTGLGASPCNKLFKKEYLLKYPFAEGIMNEDIAAVLSIIANCKKVSYTDKTKYYYVQHSSSVQNSELSEKKLDIIKSVEIFEERIKGNKEEDDFVRAVVYNQLICFLLFVPAKEKSFIKRAKFISQYGKLSQSQNLRQNFKYWQFLAGNNKRSQLFYKTYMKCACNGWGFLASFLLVFLRLKQKLKERKRVIKANIDLDMVVKACVKNQKLKSRKTISVSIPNYNYARFLYQRLYSILSQKYKINELIILDDCSSDNSRAMIDEIEEKLSPYIKIQKIYNKKNSGSTFKQWKKSLEIMTSDYLWIAEADDYCKRNMVPSLMKYIEKDSEIQLAYVDTAFINTYGDIIMPTIKPEIDIMQTGHWDSDFINDGKEEIENYAFLNCTIANVSSVIFKRDDYTDIFNELVNYKQVGDYLFYLYVMEKGKIAFVNKPLNFYRVHGNNVTSKTKKQLHFDELKKVHGLLDKKYKFNKFQKKELAKRYKFLERVWELKK